MSIQDELHEGEEIRAQFSPHPLIYSWHYLAGGVLSATIIGAVIGVPYLIVTEMVRRGNKYYITNRRVVHEFTFLSRKASAALHSKIQDMHVTQKLLERLFGIGNVHINTSGMSQVEIRFRGARNPDLVKKLIEEQMMGLDSSQKSAQKPLKTSK